jgi:hypothetical protein
MYRGVVADHGEDILNALGRFDIVLSGHYHHRSNGGGIYYLGSPYEFIWSDFDDPRGFHIFDTETRELEFIENPNVMHRKIFYYDKDKKLPEVLAPAEKHNLKDAIVKVIVQTRENPYWYDLFMGKIDEQLPADTQSVEDHLNADILVEDQIIQEAEDTLTIFRKTIASLDNDVVDKGKLEKYVTDLYNEAMAVE